MGRLNCMTPHLVKNIGIFPHYDFRDKISVKGGVFVTGRHVSAFVYMSCKVYTYMSQRGALPSCVWAPLCLVGTGPWQPGDLCLRVCCAATSAVLGHKVSWHNPPF